MRRNLDSVSTSSTESYDGRGACADALLTSSKQARTHSTGSGHMLFESFFMAGFECSEQRLLDGGRLDMLASTRHEELASLDYARLRTLGMRVCREGASWVRCEPRAGHFDFSHLRSRLTAADVHGVQVIWDLMHFGWPDDVDVFATSFPGRFASYAAALARWLRAETSLPCMFSPINEMSYLAWAGGDVRCMNPFEAARGVELKAQLVLATIEAIEAIRHVLPGARFLQPEPAICIVANPEHPRTFRRVESDNLLQFQTWDMLTGRVWPRLGGRPDYLDIVGVNFYPDNQFTSEGTTISPSDARYRPLSEILCEVQQRYDRPIIVSETGSEGEERAGWLRYVSEQCLHALQADCDLHGITIYPIVNHPGWCDERHCHNGAWDYADTAGHREPHQPLCDEVIHQAPRLRAEQRAMCARRHGLTLLA